MNSIDSKPFGLPGLDQAQLAVRKILDDPEVIHAVMLAGQEGSGAMTLAKILAQGWMCTGTGSKPCQECSVCRSMSQGKAVDFVHIEPMGLSRNILVKQIVDIQDGVEPSPNIPVSVFFRTRPLLAARKVVLIQDADRLGSRAFNSLLKILEEPPAFAKLILTTDSVSQIAPTILSRCLTLVCNLPDPAEIREVFGELSEMEALFSEGTPERVARMREHAELYSEIYSAFERLPRTSRAEALRVSEDFRALGDKLGETLKIGKRQGNAEILRLLGIWWAARGAGRGSGLELIAESHRYIIGNGSSSVV